MTSPQGIWFVYRSHYEGLLSKRIRRLTAPSILAWFQDKITEARTSLTPAEIADADFGGIVHGFGSLFEAAKKDSLHTPKTTGTSTSKAGPRTFASTSTRSACSPAMGRSSSPTSSSMTRR
jgi:hypothetical protein